jgi:hypothetical protein
MGIEPPAGWPQIKDAAFRGLAGDVVRAIQPHTEADPAGLLLTLLACVGSSVNSAPHALADGAEHPARLNVVLVGETSRARKGTAHAQIRRVMRHADPGWSDERTVGGLGSGEGLIAAVADTGEGPARDKRLLVFEPEFSRVLNVAAREGCTLSQTVRQAWDTGDLSVITRKDPLRVTRAHVSVIGHVTLEELRRRLTDTEAANGFANRFLFGLVRRARLLPSGGNLEESEVSDFGRRVRAALERFRRLTRLRRSHEAEVLWKELYEQMAMDLTGGLAGAITARAEAQVLRLSVVYAGLDGSSEIDESHLEAAWAVWQFCERSAAYIFESATGDEVADRLLRALREAAPAGLDGTQQRDLFGRHVSGDRLANARQHLEDLGLAETVTEGTGGRPRIITFANATEAT